LPIVGRPQWSADGSWITFYGGVGLHAQIYIVRPDGSGFRRVTDGHGDLVWPSFSPDNSKIAYHPVYGHLHTINFDGSGRIQHPPRVSHCRWSPDGRYIVYSNWAIPTYDSDLFLYDFTTGESTQITHHSPGQAYILAAWSPDGKKLAAEVADRNRTGDKNDIWIMDADGSNQVNFTSAWPNSHELRASWSSDGKYLVFLSDISGNFDIWYSPVDHFEPVNITNSPEDEAEPVIGLAEPVPMIEAVIDIDPDVFEVEVDPNKEAEEPEEAFLRAFIEPPADVNVADVNISTVTLSLNDTILATAESPVTVGKVLDVLFRLNLTNVSNILGLEVTDVEADDEKIEVKATTAASRPIDLIELTISGELMGGGSFTGSDAVRVMLEEESTD